MKIPIVLASDDNYAQHLTVTLLSLLENSSKKNFYQLFILDDDISEHTKAIIKKSLASFQNKSLKFIKFNKSTLNKIKDSPTKIHSFYFRLMLPSVFPKIKKIIYLDSDLLVFDDVSKLFAKKIRQKDYIAGVRILHPNYQRVLESNFRIDKLEQCINTGVLLLNLEKMRQDNAEKQMLEFLNKNTQRLLAADQDIINVVFNTKITPLNIRWNVGSYFFYAKNITYLGISKYSFEKILKNPGIIHFDGYKPWTTANWHPYSSHYKKFLKRTEFPKKIPFSFYHLKRNTIFAFGATITRLIPDIIYSKLLDVYLKNNALEKRKKGFTSSK
jgi:lipopolysaccharide biosynthesis glycosyltransferase